MNTVGSNVDRIPDWFDGATKDSDFIMCNHCGMTLKSDEEGIELRTDPPHVCVPMMRRDMQFLADQLNIIEHLQDGAAVASIRTKYGLTSVVDL